MRAWLWRRCGKPTRERSTDIGCTIGSTKIMAAAEPYASFALGFRIQVGARLSPTNIRGRCSMSRSFRQIIDAAVREKRFLVVPGAHDALSARLIEKIGFDAYFIGGFPAVGARYGVPDIGLKGFGE